MKIERNLTRVDNLIYIRYRDANKKVFEESLHKIDGPAFIIANSTTNIIRYSYRLYYLPFHPWWVSKMRSWYSANKLYLKIINEN